MTREAPLALPEDAVGPHLKPVVVERNLKTAKQRGLCLSETRGGALGGPEQRCVAVAVGERRSTRGYGPGRRSSLAPRQKL
ncbi:hypothetical protein EYF80_052340 [Liparis tanakae]|uniref:Uncharacterized protein n=1 Tax=Liparis tanakae TaxID=230148 RepID=A0A4Z2F9M6_9TELE|nr:hypothetical protein EYF80_052340 [Liparis tanakae]